jgi:hypothetical protein
MYVLLCCGVCTSVRLLPGGENPSAVRNNNNNNNNKGVFEKTNNISCPSQPSQLYERDHVLVLVKVI